MFLAFSGSPTRSQTSSQVIGTSFMRSPYLSSISTLASPSGSLLCSASQFTPSSIMRAISMMVVIGPREPGTWRSISSMKACTPTGISTLKPPSSVAMAQKASFTARQSTSSRYLSLSSSRTAPFGRPSLPSPIWHSS